MNIEALFKMSYGVYVAATLNGSQPTGCIANSAMQITAEPATIAVSIHHDNFTNSCVQKTKKFALCVLSENTDPAVIGSFGFHSGRDYDKFSKHAYEMKDGLPVLKDCCSYILCKVIDSWETPTHTVFLGEVTGCDILHKEDTPMTYAYYHQVIKGKSPKNAPTYVPPARPKQKKVYKCSICGYEYNGDTPFEELPEDYECPICKAKKELFQPM